VHVESNQEPQAARWLERSSTCCQWRNGPRLRSAGEQRLDPEWIRRLGVSGKDCYTAIINCDLEGLGASMNECMRCWEAILPQTVRHQTVTVDLKAILEYYQSRYAGAMYSGCGGGYLYVVSPNPCRVRCTFR